MAKSKLFEVVILEHPMMVKDGEPEGKTRLVHGPAAVLARDEQQAILQVVMRHTSRLDQIDQDRMEVLVRPF